MSDKSNEKISNLMDGELEVQASRFLLKRLASDKDLSGTWKRYHAIQSCLQKEKNEPLAIDIADSVIRTLRDDHVQMTPQESAWSRWARPVLGVGIAATVAFMSLLVIQTNPSPDQADGFDNQVLTTAVTQPAIDVNVPSAQLVGASRTVPAYLSRYPSLSAKESSIYNQAVSENQKQLPYIYIINHSQNQDQLQSPPLRNKDLAE